MGILILIVSLGINVIYFYVFVENITKIFNVFDIFEFINVNPSWEVLGFLMAIIYLIIPETYAFLLHRKTRFQRSGITIAVINILLSLLIMFFVVMMSGV